MDIKKLNEKLTKIVEDQYQKDEFDSEASLMDAFETVRGSIETAMQFIKLSSEPINYVRIMKALSKLKDATHSYKIAKDPNTRYSLVSTHLQDCYEYLQEAKKQLDDRR